MNFEFKFCRLKDGDFTEVLPEEDLDEQINSEKPYANNSFIQFECEDESFSENKENKHNNQSYVEEDSDFNIEEKENNHENVETVVDRNAWAKGIIKQNYFKFLKNKVKMQLKLIPLPTGN